MTATGAGRGGPGISTLRVRLLLFATARIAVGAPSLSWPVRPDGTTVRELVDELARAHPRVAPILAHSRFFHDGVPVVRQNERIRPGEELAIHPPYGGG